MTPRLRRLFHRQSPVVARVQAWTPEAIADESDLGQVGMTELILMLEKARMDNATAFVVVAIDSDTGDVLSCTGPFEQAEQAFLQGCQDEAAWRQEKTDDDGEIAHVTLPIWAPVAA